MTIKLLHHPHTKPTKKENDKMLKCYKCKKLVTRLNHSIKKNGSVYRRIMVCEDCYNKRKKWLEQRNRLEEL